MSDLSLREEIIAACQWLNRNGYNQLTSGNISVRCSGSDQVEMASAGSFAGMLITPSGIDYDQLTVDQLISLPCDYDGAPLGCAGTPSSEWRLHRDILQARPEVNAVVHTHSVFATAVAITRQEIPPCHYMVAAFGGENIRCAPYARFGTERLSDYAVEALQGRTACLLSNHGMVAIGKDLKTALWFTVQLETLAQQFLYSQTLGGGVLLTREQIEETAVAMKGYLGGKI